MAVVIWPELAVFIGLILAAQGLGRLALAPLVSGAGQKPGNPELSRLETFVWTQGLGLAGLLALAGILSFLGALRPLPVVLVLILPGLWGAWGLIRGLGLKPKPGLKLSLWEKVFLVGIICHLFVCLIQALAPPTWGDGLHVMFVFAREYAAQGSVHYLPSVYASRPQNMTLLFTLAQLFGRPEGAQLISWWLGLLSVLGLTGLTTRAAGRKIGLATGLLLAAMPLLGQLTGRGMSGTGLLFFSILGLMAVREIFEEKRPVGWAAAAGLCLGLAAGFKVAGLSVVVIGLAATVFEMLRRRWGLGRAAVLIVAALAIASPWYIYSWAHTGQVFYTSGPLKGLLSPADLARWGVATGSRSAVEAPPAPGKSIKRSAPAVKSSKFVQLLILKLKQEGNDPFRNLWNINILSGHRGRNVGPFILLFIPVLIFLRPVARPVVWLVWVGILHAGLTTFLLGPYARYALPGLALALAGSAWAWWSMVKRGGWTFILAVMLLLAGWGVLVPERAYTLVRDFPVAVGLADRTAYTGRAFPDSTKAYGWINKNLPPDARVVVIAESRSWFLKRRFFDAKPNQSPLFNYSVYRDWTDLDRAVDRVRAGYAVINWQKSDNAWELGRGDQEWYQALVKTWAGNRLKPLYQSGQITVYKIKQEGSK